jgi:hypothetical protein
MRILILSSSLFTDRILFYSSILNVYPKANFTIWKTSYLDSVDSEINTMVDLEEFPKIQPLSEKLNFLRKVNDFAWTFKLNAVSIKSMKSFSSRNKTFSFYNWIIKVLGWLVYIFCLNYLLEKIILKIAVQFSKSFDVRNRLMAKQFDLIVTMNPFWQIEREVAIEGKKLHIPVVAFIPSWDNITTKSRLIFEPNSYIVWSDVRIKELYDYYPKSRLKQVFALGAPQYDVFLKDQLLKNKLDFLKEHNLDPMKKTILYTLGSPNFLACEYDGVKRFIDIYLKNGLNQKYNLIIRPHPNKDTNQLQNSICKYDNIILQHPKNAHLITSERSQDLEDIKQWVNTFKHVDVVINLFSTVIFDGLYFNKEIININFDPSEGIEFKEFINEINTTWTHLKPLYMHPALNYANSFNEMFDMIESILDRGSLKLLKHKESLFEEVCGKKDGLNGQRFGEAILNSYIN